MKVDGMIGTNTLEVVVPGVKLIAGTDRISTQPFVSFDGDTIEFLGCLSDRIRAIPRENAGEELKSLGFWLRRFHLLDIKRKKIPEGSGQKLGLGMSFHIVPSNVPLMFFYSCAIGLLAGNSCVVRMSDRSAEVDLQLCRMLDEMLKEKQFCRMRSRIAFVSFERSREDLTEYFSRACDARIVWGGDRTIQEIRKIPVKVTAAELMFPDRRSAAILDAEAVLKLNTGELELLAVRFYNDTYAMDQNACSCPEIIFWKEPDEQTGKYASEKFWETVAAAAKKYALSEMKVSRKYGVLWENMASGVDAKCVRRWDNRLYVVELSDVNALKRTKKLQFGCFFECHMKENDEWIRAMDEKIQTLTYFGMDRDELADTVVRNSCRGCYHIVPLGQALWMEPDWDGKDMIAQLSRTI